MSVRSQLATALQPLLPANMRVIYVPRSLDGVETNRPVLMLYRNQLAKAPNAQGQYLNTLSLWIVSTLIDPNRAEDDLDEALDAVIGAIDALSWVNWKTAERSTFGDAQAPAYRIDLTVATNKE